MRALRTLLLLTAIAVPPVVVTGAGPAGSVPDQASPAGEEHAHTHGPDPLSLDRRGRPTAAATYDVDTPASWSGTWAGGTVTSDQTDTTSLPKFHAIYMHPYDQPNRVAQFGNMFEADAAQASSRLAAYGRNVRWDRRQSTGLLDITVVTSSSNSKRLGGGNQFSLVRNELVKKKFTDPNKKYVVWLDARSNYCGQGELYQDTRRSSANYNEQRMYAIVYRPYASSDPTTGGFCRGRTLLHEMGHTMGALQKVAPNAFDGAHCDDSAEDVMCYTSATSFDSGNEGVFDYKNDDYWDPPSGTLPWWTVNLSRFVCPTTQC